VTISIIEHPVDGIKVAISFDRHAELGGQHRNLIGIAKVQYLEALVRVVGVGQKIDGGIQE